jgi:hypothetical protein
MNKVIIGISILAVLSACENGWADNRNSNPLVDVRSAVYDTVNGCVVEEVHTHNGIQYSGHYNNDGHGHHRLATDEACVLSGCNDTGLYQHNGTHYAGHAGNDGCSHHGNGHHA